MRANQKTGSDEVSRAWMLQAAALDRKTQCQWKRRIRDTQRGRWSVKSQMEDLLLLLADPTIITSGTSCRFFISWWFCRFNEDVWQLNNGRQKPAHLRLSALDEIFKNILSIDFNIFNSHFEWSYTEYWFWALEIIERYSQKSFVHVYSLNRWYKYFTNL